MKQQLAFIPPAAEELKAIRLTEADIDACFTLQQSVRKKLLLDGTPHYLKPLTKESFKEHFDAGMPVIGVKNEKGELVAMSRLTFPNPKNINSLSASFGGADLKGTAIIGGVAVSLTGQNLAVTMLEEAKVIAAEYGFDAILGKVAKTNLGSHKQFGKAKFGEITTGVDASCDCLNQPYEYSVFKWPTPAIKIG